MVARLGFSIATDITPEILIVDEVLGVGDAAFQAKSSERMRELLTRGATVLLVSHNLEVVRAPVQPRRLAPPRRGRRDRHPDRGPRRLFPEPARHPAKAS